MLMKQMESEATKRTEAPPTLIGTQVQSNAGPHPDPYAAYAMAKVTATTTSPHGARRSLRQNQPPASAHEHEVGVRAVDASHSHDPTHPSHDLREVGMAGSAAWVGDKPKEDLTTPSRREGNSESPHPPLSQTITDGAGVPVPPADESIVSVTVQPQEAPTHQRNVVQRTGPLPTLPETECSQWFLMAVGLAALVALIAVVATLHAYFHEDSTHRNRIIILVAICAVFSCFLWCPCYSVTHSYVTYLMRTVDEGGQRRIFTREDCTNPFRAFCKVLILILMAPWLLWYVCVRMVLALLSCLGTGCCNVLERCGQCVCSCCTALHDRILEPLFECVSRCCSAVLSAVWSALVCVFGPVWRAVACVGRAIRDGLRAACVALCAALTAVGNCVQATVCLPIYHCMSAVGRTVWSVLCAIGRPIRTLALFVWSGVAAVARCVGDACSWVCSRVCACLSAVGAFVWSTITAVFQCLYRTLIQPCVTGARLCWSGCLRPCLSGIFRILRLLITWPWVHVLRPLLSFLGSALRSVLRAIGSVLGAVARAVGAAIGAVVSFLGSIVRSVTSIFR